MTTRSADIPELVGEIESARRRFLELIASLSVEARRIPIADGKWSPLQYLEHLVLAEEATIWRMFVAIEEGRSSRKVLSSSTPRASIEAVVDATWQEREQAPPLAVPRLGGSSEYWSVRLQRNAQLVARLADFIDPAELETRAYSHPISGPLTIRQGFEFIRFHLERHHQQITSRATSN